MSRDVQKTEKTKKPVFKRVWFWVVVIIVVVIIGSAMGADEDGPKKVDTVNDASKSDASNEAEEEKTEFKVGDVISFDGKEVTVKSVERNFSTGNEFMTPASGKEYVKVNVLVQNKSDEKASYNTFDWKIQDSDGAIEGSSIMGSDDDSLGSGELAKGGKKTGSIVFEVPKGDKKLVLHYEPSFWSDKEVTIKL